MIKLSVDDGCASDMRIADLCKKYEIPVIFYIPVEWHSLAAQKGYDPLDYRDAYHLAQEFEVGSHTITHPHLTRVPEDDAIYEIVASKTILQQMLNTKITKFCPPRGYTNDNLTKITNEVYQTQRLTRGPGLVHIHPDSGANNNRRWVDCIDDSTTELWCHSWELDKFDLWDELEEYFRAYTSF